jgi:hypothetical protein
MANWVRRSVDSEAVVTISLDSCVYCECFSVVMENKFLVEPSFIYKSIKPKSYLSWQ